MEAFLYSTLFPDVGPIKGSREGYATGRVATLRVGSVTPWRKKVEEWGSDEPSHAYRLSKADLTSIC